MTEQEAIAKLDHLLASDPETAHIDADAILIDYLKDQGGPASEVARAWERASERIGFWYS